MDDRRQRLLDVIDRAFEGVELGHGVSLHEAEVIDGYGTPEQREAARTPDEKRDWWNLINDPELSRICGWEISGLSFFDAAGLRFHLPACLSQVIKDPESEESEDIRESVLFHLTDLNRYQKERFAILNGGQRQCVLEVLMFLREKIDDEQGAVEQAITHYWRQDAVP
jgi:hypothetical protein